MWALGCWQRTATRNCTSWRNLVIQAHEAEVSQLKRQMEVNQQGAQSAASKALSDLQQHHTKEKTEFEQKQETEAAQMKHAEILAGVRLRTQGYKPIVALCGFEAHVDCAVALQFLRRGYMSYELWSKLLIGGFSWGLYGILINRLLGFIRGFFTLAHLPVPRDQAFWLSADTWSSQHTVGPHDFPTLWSHTLSIAIGYSIIQPQYTAR